MARGAAGGKGFAEAKVIIGLMRPIVERLKEYAQYSRAYARDLAFVDTASQTALRVSEVAHLKKEDILPNGVVVIRRKKKVLVPRSIPVNPEGLARIREWSTRVDSGYIFPGNSSPCIIRRRPKFEAEDCPDCGKKVAPRSMVKRKADRISLFFQHLNVDHDRSADEVREWIDFASVEEEERFCDGGHLSIRHFEGRWQDLMKDLGIYLPGRGVHAIRHAAITRFYNETRDLMATRDYAGHEDVSMTQRYTHIELESKVAKLPVDWV